MKQSVTLKSRRSVNGDARSMGGYSLETRAKLVQDSYADISINNQQTDETLSRQSLPLARVDVNLAQADQKTEEDLVQKSFMKFPGQITHASKSLVNFTKLPVKHQLSLNKMRRAEQNSSKRKDEVVKVILKERLPDDDSKLSIKSDECYRSIDPVKRLRQA